MPESMQRYFATTLLRILEKQVSVCLCACACVCVYVCRWLVLALLIVVLAVLFATFVVAMSFD